MTGQMTTCLARIIGGRAETLRTLIPMFSKEIELAGLRIFLGKIQMAFKH
jgi:hypothetical protein